MIMEYNSKNPIYKGICQKIKEKNSILKNKDFEILVEIINYFFEIIIRDF